MSPPKRNNEPLKIQRPDQDWCSLGSLTIHVITSGPIIPAVLAIVFEKANTVPGYSEGGRGCEKMRGTIAGFTVITHLCSVQEASDTGRPRLWICRASSKSGH